MILLLFGGVGGWRLRVGWTDCVSVSMCVWILYVENHVLGHDEVRTKHVMSNGLHPWEGCPKVNPQSNNSFRTHSIS
jgi:hypothetical protein